VNIVALAKSKLSFRNKNEEGSLVESVLMVVIFIVLAIFVVTLMSNGLSNSASRIADCIESPQSNPECSEFEPSESTTPTVETDFRK
jgi:hypothetical protein